MTDQELEHRLTTLEVTLKQGLDNIVALGVSNGNKATAMTDALTVLAGRVGMQNHRIDKIEVVLTDIKPTVDAMNERGADTNAVVRFIREAGGIGNGVILLGISIGTFIIVYTR